MNGLSEELKKGQTMIRPKRRPPPVHSTACRIFKKFRQDDDFSFSTGEGEANPAAQFQKLTTEGPSMGCTWS